MHTQGGCVCHADRLEVGVQLHCLQAAWGAVSQACVWPLQQAKCELVRRCPQF